MFGAIELKNKYVAAVQCGKYDKLHRDSKDTIMSDYLAISELHQRVRENKMTKDEFFIAVDTILCW